MTQETHHGEFGRQDRKDSMPPFCQEMAEKMASCGPMMKEMMARCGPMMEKMMGLCTEKAKPDTPSATGAESTNE